MEFLDNIANSLNSFSSKTKKNYDITKIEFRIKSYTAEADEIYKQIGKIVYAKRDRLTDGNRAHLTELFGDLASIAHRIKNLEKSISSIKTGAVKQEAWVVEPIPTASHKALNKKDDDLTIRRTEEGIKILRFCPKCHSENTSKADECVSCRYIFKKHAN